MTQKNKPSSRRAPKEQIEFAVALAQQDFTKLRQSDLPKLRESLGQFFEVKSKVGERGRLLAVPTKAPLPKTFNREDFRKLQRETLEILKQLVDQRVKFSGWKGEPLKSKLLRLKQTKIGLLSQAFGGAPGAAFFAASGTTRDMFLLKLCYLLAEAPTGNILRCPQCSRIFLRTGKEKYCSRTCTNRASQRAWRQTEKGKKARRVQAKRRYTKKK